MNDPGLDPSEHRALLCILISVTSVIIAVACWLGALAWTGRP